MGLRNPRYALLSFVLLVILFSAIYLVTNLTRNFTPGYLAAALILFYTGTALNRARRVVAPPRFPILQENPENLALPAFEQATFKSRDGVELSGWYIPSGNTGAVIMVHSLGSSRLQMRNFARALVDSGYGILMFDLRAHARSGGGFSAFGWIEHQDVLGAYDFLKEREEIDPARIGLLGFSLGAQIALRAAAGTGLFSAVWVDGPIPIVYADHFAAASRFSLRRVIFSPWWWLAYNTQEWLTGLDQPPALVDVIGNISPRPLMVAAAGSDRMIAAARRFYEAAGEPKQFWQLDEIPFGTGILEKGDDYDIRLIGFFNRSM
ncbi:MAG TPA: alpha/beta fold hydrolase [Anaerolineales bacterium]|nr:alpha/beta fold hydrolase [Anaerolineales bacterium]